MSIQRGSLWANNGKTHLRGKEITWLFYMIQKVNLGDKMPSSSFFFLVDLDFGKV